jgi:hypothetical protein
MTTRWFLAIALATACSSSKSDKPAIDAPPTPMIDAAIDAPAGPDAPPPTACQVKVSATPGGCSDDCDARLTLPNNSRFCTVICTNDPDCKVYSASLTCSTEVGTCMPSCTTDASCQAAGFPRCHPVGSFCDTIPACQTDKQCQDLGYARCVMPARYCE